jgi:16S rRNA processing protein RimM
VTEKFVTGLVGSPFGLKGFLKVRPCSGEIDHLLKLQSVVVSKDGKERTFQIEESSAAPPSVLMLFKGVDSIEKAKTLTGARLIAGREDAVPLGKDEFYIEDLKGLPITAAENGENIGQITDIIEGGGGELAEVKLSNGKVRLVPFRKEFFPEICPEKDRVLLKNLWILE